MNQHNAPLLIPRSILDAMIDHCRREAPRECCGLLGGVPPAVSSIDPLRNTEVEAGETRYNADPADLVAAVRRLRDRNAEILAIYHSHPRWAPIPSRADLDLNYYGAVPRIIVSLLDDKPQVRAWRLDPDSYEELPWQVAADSDVEPGRPAD